MDGVEAMADVRGNRPVKMMLYVLDIVHYRYFLDLHEAIIIRLSAARLNIPI